MEEKKDFFERVVGGLFGIVAIVAAILEFNLPEQSALFGCIKDISGTIVVVLLLFISVKIPSFSVAKKLEQAVEDWGIDNLPLIFKAKDYENQKDTNYIQGFKLLQYPEKYITLINEKIENNPVLWDKYAKYRSDVTGKFICMPSYQLMTKNDFSINITLKQHHFENKDSFSLRVDEMKSAFNSRFTKYAHAERPGNALELNIKYYKKIQNKTDIEMFVDSLDFILSLVKVSM